MAWMDLRSNFVERQPGPWAAVRESATEFGLERRVVAAADQVWFLVRSRLSQQLIRQVQFLAFVQLSQLSGERGRHDPKTVPSLHAFKPVTGRRCYRPHGRRIGHKRHKKHQRGRRALRLLCFLWPTLHRSGGRRGSQSGFTTYAHSGATDVVMRSRGLLSVRTSEAVLQEVME